MDPLNYINFILDVVVLIALIYFCYFIIPTQNIIFKECNERVLCKNGYLNGKICKGYEIDNDVDTILKHMNLTK